MNLFRCAAVFALGLLTNPALANPCHNHLDMLSDPSATAASKSTGHQDLGNGVVLSQHSGMDGHTTTLSSSFQVEFCHSGRSVAILYQGACFGADNPFCDHVGLKDAGTFKSDPAPIRAAILKMTTSARAYTWDTFTQRLEDLGARLLDPVISDFESCACAVFYPDLKGDKRPNKIRTQGQATE